MRTSMIRTAAIAAFLAGATLFARADDGSLTVIGLDNSESFPVFTNKSIARAAAATAADAISDLKPGDRVIIRSFGLAGVAPRQIDIEVVIGKKGQSRPNRVAKAVAGLIRSLPERVERGDIQVQSRTNIIGFIQGLAPSLDCDAVPTRLILFTDSIEWSTQVRGDDLVAGKASLPISSAPDLKGCSVEMYGIGQQTAALGTDSLWFPRLEAQWSAFFDAAGVDSFAGHAEFE